MGGGINSAQTSREMASKDARRFARHRPTSCWVFFRECRVGLGTSRRKMFKLSAKTKWLFLEFESAGKELPNPQSPKGSQSFRLLRSAKTGTAGPKIPEWFGNEETLKKNFFPVLRPGIFLLHAVDVEMFCVQRPLTDKDEALSRKTRPWSPIRSTYGRAGREFPFRFPILEKPSTKEEPGKVYILVLRQFGLGGWNFVVFLFIFVDGTAGKDETALI